MGKFWLIKNKSSQCVVEEKTEGQIIGHIAIQFVLLCFTILMFDLLIDLLVGVGYLLVDLAHTGIDAIEYSIELILEHTVHTDHQQSEVIIVNSVLFIILVVVYKGVFMLPKLCAQGINSGKEKWYRYKQHKAKCWKKMSMTLKIKVMSAYILGISCLLFLLTL
jgi:Na+/proline symporter